ncbi:MAG: hypothetical protein ACLUAR_14720 [Pilosibacter sp.]
MEQRIVTKTSFYTNIMLLSIPIILQQFLRVSVDLCDSIMLGRIDQVQMAAVSQAQQIFSCSTLSATVLPSDAVF